ncbi:MAG: 50S ribosomal protein L22 [Verrucomicrobia bacterium]|jgi:large subunit ribosomal protein L22|nr:50S ribosomal protein L22 [Verrucomicrobiota bacterium]
MDIVAYTKYSRISARKARELTRELPGRRANEALELLKFIPRKAARLLGKTLHSAVANAENNHNLNSDDLVIKEAVVEEGPAFRRFKAAARGSAKPIRKRTSHLRIVLTESSN